MYIFRTTHEHTLDALTLNLDIQLPSNLEFSMYAGLVVQPIPGRHKTVVVPRMTLGSRSRSFAGNLMRASSPPSCGIHVFKNSPTISSGTSRSALEVFDQSQGRPTHTFHD